MFRVDGTVRRGPAMKIPEHGPDLASLRELVDSLPALIHTGLPDGYLDFFNQRWLEFVGLRLEDLEGWKWTAAVHPDDVTALVTRWRACLVSGEPLECEARVRRADGEYRWMLHHKVPARDACGHVVKWYGSSIDIEDRKRAEATIREQERELERAHVLAVLEEANWLIAGPRGAAARLGMKRTTLPDDERNPDDKLKRASANDRRRDQRCWSAMASSLAGRVWPPRRAS